SLGDARLSLPDALPISDRLVASAEMDEAGALGAAEAGPEEPAAAFEPAPPEDVAAEAVVDPEAIVTWHAPRPGDAGAFPPEASRSEEHTSELQSRENLV